MNERRERVVTVAWILFRHRYREKIQWYIKHFFLSCVLIRNNTNYLPPLNWSTHQNEPQVLQMPATAPPPPPPRRSQRHVSHTDGETSGYHSDNHLIDPAAANYHLRRQLPSSRGRVEPLPPDTASVVIVDNQQDGHNVISARADYKFLERKKWVQDGTVPYDLYPEVRQKDNLTLNNLQREKTFFFLFNFKIEFVVVSSSDLW